MPKNYNLLCFVEDDFCFNFEENAENEPHKNGIKGPRKELNMFIKQIRNLKIPTERIILIKVENFYLVRSARTSCNFLIMILSIITAETRHLRSSQSSGNIECNDQTHITVDNLQ